ncbi:MAG: hypothetical protein AAB726_02270 [Patescibacteria group bacterium]
MKAVKLILFIILAPIFLPLYLLLALTYHGGDKDKSWLDKLWNEGGAAEKILYLILAPFYFLIAGFLYFTFEFWEKLLDE